MQQAALRGSIEIEASAQRGQHVVHQPAVAVEITRVVADDPRSPCTSSQVHQRTSECTLVAASAMTLYLHSNPSAERFAPLMQRPFGVITPPVTYKLRNGTRRRPCQQVQSLRTLGHVRPGHAGHSTPALPIGRRPIAQRSDSRARDERREVAAALNVASDERHRPSIDS